MALQPVREGFKPGSTSTRSPSPQASRFSAERPRDGRRHRQAPARSADRSTTLSSLGHAVRWLVPMVPDLAARHLGPGRPTPCSRRLKAAHGSASLVDGVSSSSSSSNTSARFGPATAKNAERLSSWLTSLGKIVDGLRPRLHDLSRGGRAPNCSTSLTRPTAGPGQARAGAGSCPSSTTCCCRMTTGAGWAVLEFHSSFRVGIGLVLVDQTLRPAPGAPERRPGVAGRDQPLPPDDRCSSWPGSRRSTQRLVMSSD